MGNDEGFVQEAVREFAEYIKKLSARRYAATTEDGQQIEVVLAMDYDIAISRAETAENGLATLQIQLAERELQEREILAQSNTGVPWVHEDTFGYLVQNLAESREYNDQLTAKLKRAEAGARNVAQGLAVEVAVSYETEMEQLHAALEAACGQHLDDGPPPVDERVQIILNARRGPRGDRWLTDMTGALPSLVPDAWVVGWRPAWAGSLRGIEMRQAAELLRKQAEAAEEVEGDA